MLKSVIIMKTNSAILALKKELRGLKAGQNNERVCEIQAEMQAILDSELKK